MSNASPNILITRNHLDGVSDTFLIGTQSTVYAMGLQPGDVVEFFVCLVSDLVRSACVCPSDLVKVMLKLMPNFL